MLYNFRSLRNAWSFISAPRNRGTVCRWPWAEVASGGRDVGDSQHELLSQSGRKQRKRRLSAWRRVRSDGWGVMGACGRHEVLGYMGGELPERKGLSAVVGRVNAQIRRPARMLTEAEAISRKA